MFTIDPDEMRKTQQDTDSTGGGFIWASDIYEVTVEQCYLIEKDSGAKALHFDFVDNGGKKYKEDLYVMSRAKKMTYDMKSKTGKTITRPLPAYVRARNILFLCAKITPEMLAPREGDDKNAEPQALVLFQKITGSMTPGEVSLYDFEQKKEVVKRVDYAMPEIVGKRVKLAIQENLENRYKNGAYIEETVSRNSIALEFDPDINKTINEVRENLDSVHHDSWLAKNQGSVREKLKFDAAKTPSGDTGSTGSTGGSMFGS